MNLSKGFKNYKGFTIHNLAMGQNPALFPEMAQQHCPASVELAAPLLVVLKRLATMLPWPPICNGAAVPDSAALHMSCPPWTSSLAVLKLKASRFSPNCILHKILIES
jgi:hypothetical protein